MLKKLPALLLESDMLVTAFHCACAGLHVQHREANRSVVSFFENLVGISNSQHARAHASPAGAHALMTLLTEHGAQLVHAMVFAATPNPDPDLSPNPSLGSNPNPNPNPNPKPSPNP